MNKKRKIPRITELVIPGIFFEQEVKKDGSKKEIIMKCSESAEMQMQEQLKKAYRKLAKKISSGYKRR